jgi:hypothetical protein
LPSSVGFSFEVNSSLLFIKFSTMVSDLVIRFTHRTCIDRRSHII